jgi:hypothetical protein
MCAWRARAFASAGAGIDQRSLRNGGRWRAPRSGRVGSANALNPTGRDSEVGELVTMLQCRVRQRSFDHLVGDGEQRDGEGKPEDLCRLEVDGQLVL